MLRLTSWACAAERPLTRMRTAERLFMGFAPIRKRSGRGLLKSSSHLRRIGIREIRPLNHENVDSLRFWIDPCLSPVGSAMAKRAGGKHRRDALGLVDDAPAEAPAVARGKARFEAGGLDRRHELDGLGLEIAFAV